MLAIEPLLRVILASYALPWYGVHGLSHWGRVLDNGLRIAQHTGANRDVVTLFALFHDAKRVNEDTDPEHGRRGALLAVELRGSLFELADDDFHHLFEACVHHTAGHTEANPTIQTCWDADRLDLGRVGVRPHPTRLCTEIGKTAEVIDWAHGRAEAEAVSTHVKPLWDELWQQS
ncbi:MAG: hypothetical protein AAF581_15670 [Planctomycetota bacterium]